jgi:hypothetical protein
VTRIRVLLLGMSLATSPAAFADGGAVRISETRGDAQITVFTAPTPLVVGSADISVLVLDSKSGKPRVDLPIRVSAFPIDHSVRTVRVDATSEAATNKLMRSASVAFAQPGIWEIDVTVEGLGPLGFGVEVDEPPPPWREMSIWIGWPLLVIAAFAVRQWMTARRASTPQRGDIA